MNLPGSASLWDPSMSSRSAFTAAVIAFDDPASTDRSSYMISSVNPGHAESVVIIS
jgi:hypothetical protein